MILLLTLFILGSAVGILSVSEHWEDSRRRKRRFLQKLREDAERQRASNEARWGE